MCYDIDERHLPVVKLVRCCVLVHTNDNKRTVNMTASIPPFPK